MTLDTMQLRHEIQKRDIDAAPGSGRLSVPC
jgi:hypothetical protein